MKRTISVLIEKDTGGLVRIVSLLTRRRFKLKVLQWRHVNENVTNV